MSVGPIIVFDKSTLQSLSLDEAVWLDNFYRANITPLFLMETLANLEKEIRSGRTAEQVVGDLARKTPVEGAVANVHHRMLCLADLAGKHVQMRRVPVIAGGQPIGAGRDTGVFFDQSAESEALSRWQRGDFIGAERQFARSWREALSTLDLRSSLTGLGDSRPKPNSLLEVRDAAERVTNRDGHRYRRLKALFEFLHVRADLRPAIVARWKSEGGPPLGDFAPYAAYVFTVDVFFYLAMAANLISPDRPSNRIDLAYLYYLPFCMVFASNDDLHAKTAPLFLADDQEFVPGYKLKADLRSLDEHYSALPAEIRYRGVMEFAPNPPREGDFLTARLWDRFLPRWRDQTDRGKRLRDEVGDKAILEALRPMMEAAKRPGHSGPIDVEKVDQLIVSRKIPVERGKWRIVPPEVAAGIDE